LGGDWCEHAIGTEAIGENVDEFAGGMFMQGRGVIGGLRVKLFGADATLAEHGEGDTFDTETHVEIFDVAAEERPEMFGVATGAAEVDTGGGEVFAFGAVAGEFDIEGAHAAVFEGEFGFELREEFVGCMFDSFGACGGACEIDEEMKGRFRADGGDEVEGVAAELIEASGDERAEAGGEA